jgi:hypothetical protein
MIVVPVVNGNSVTRQEPHFFRFFAAKAAAAVVAAALHVVIFGNEWQ